MYVFVLTSIYVCDWMKQIINERAIQSGTGGSRQTNADILVRFLFTYDQFVLPNPFSKHLTVFCILPKKSGH